MKINKTSDTSVYIKKPISIKQRKNRRQAMKIDIPTDTSVYIEIGDTTFYIDNSTDEPYMNNWTTKDKETS